MNERLIKEHTGHDVKVYRDEEYIIVNSLHGDVVKFDDEICIVVYSYGNPKFIEDIISYYHTKRTGRDKIEWDDEWTNWLNDLKLQRSLCEIYSKL